MPSRLFVIILAVAAIACRDVTGPGTRHAASIVNIQTPAHATFTDTIWISFLLAGSPCDTGFVVSSERVSDGVRFSASSVMTNSDVCTRAGTALIALAVPVPFVFPATPPHPVPFVARFAQPGGVDSVRTVQP